MSSPGMSRRKLWPRRPPPFERVISKANATRCSVTALSSSRAAARRPPRAPCIIRDAMPPQYSFTMRDLRKVVPPKREILRGINLAFFPGAKIGVLGANGAGKSSLLRIMAGVDPDFLGEARPADDIRIGYLPQEPRLDPAKTVLGNIEEGVATTRDLLRRFEEVSGRFAEPMSDAEMEKLLAEQGRLQDAIEAVGGWELDRTVEMAMDALRVPPGEQDVRTLSGGEARRVALCRLLLERPDMLLLDEPTNHLA